MQKQWQIRYYLSESSFKLGIPAFTERVMGDRNFVTNFATNKLRTSQFKFFDLVEL